MTQDQHIRSSSSHSRVRPKTVKQKKVLQRGLGVAQLEKLRLEKQRTKEALQVQAPNALANKAAGSASAATLHCPNLSHNTPNLVPSPLEFPSPNVVFNASASSVTEQLKEGGWDIRWRPISIPGHDNWSRLLNDEHSPEGEKQRADHLGFALWPHESNPLVLPQRLYRFRRPTSSLVCRKNYCLQVNASSILSSQIEPPSNQSLCRSSYASSLSEGEDKTVGMKRSCPFSPYSPPPPSFARNSHAAASADELPSCSIGCTTQKEARIKYTRCREGPLNSSPLLDQMPSDLARDNGGLIGDFLTLAPPLAASPPLNSKHKRPMDFSGHHGLRLCQFKCLPGQENLESQILQLGPEQPFISFFPVKSQTAPTTSHVMNASGFKGESIDLNLKL